MQQNLQSEGYKNTLNSKLSSTLHKTEQKLKNENLSFANLLTQPPLVLAA